MKRYFIFLFVLMLAMGTIFSEGQSEVVEEEKEFVLSYSETVPITRAQCVFALKLGELVEEKTNGSVKIEVYPDGSLAGYSLEPAQAGIADMVQVQGGVAADLVPWMGILDAPYMISPGEHFHKVANSRSPVVEGANEELEKHNLKLLGGYNYGTRDLTAKKPIYNLNDLKNLRMRVVPSPTAKRTWEIFGAYTSPMPSSEMVTAMLTGVVEAQENSWHDIVGFSLWDVQNYIMDTNHLATFASVYINRSKFLQMSESQQESLLDAFNEASEWFTYTYTVEKMEEYMDLVLSNGMTVIGVDDGLKVDEFKKRAEQFYAENRDVWGKWEEVINSLR